MSRWQRYWFADGGRLAAAIVRIAIASAVLLSLARLRHVMATGDVLDARGYRPVGVWMVLGHRVPPGALVDLLWIVAWAGTLAMLVGLATRASTAASFAASVALASLSFAGQATWSHQYNVVFLAQLAFLGARGGDALSADALIRRLRGRPPIDVARGYQWSLRLVQLAVALMFAGAVFHKILHGHFTLRWATSDNLRHHLLVRFDLAGLPRPEVVQWIIDDVWRYRVAAALNLISQAMPIVACFAIRRPLVRAACGACFVVETIALGLVVDLWNLHWLPLVAVFVDWDALYARVRRRPRLDVAVAPLPAGWRPPRAARGFVVAFVVYDAVTAFVPAVDQWLNTYPFSGFPMFATIRARAPYDEHLPYAVPGDHAEVLADHPIDAATQRWFDHANRTLYTIDDPDVLRVKLDKLLDRARQRYPALGIHGIRWWLVIFEAPAYPAPAHFEPHRIAVTGEIRDDHTFRTALCRASGGTLEPRPRGVDLAGARYVYYRDDEPVPIALADRVVPDGDPLYVVAIAADGTPWLVLRKDAWKWQ